jgi:hypothetical protein
VQNNGLLPPLDYHGSEQGNPSHGGAGDLGHEGLGELGKEGGDQGEHEGQLTLDGEGRQTAGDGQPWRSARSARGGGAPVLRR